MQRIVPTAACTSLLFLLAAPAATQTGSAVATRADDVLVVSPSAGRGPAAVLVYRRDGNAWKVVQRLGTEGTAQRGHGLSPSVTFAGDLLLVGSGDPDGQWAAHGFARDASGRWNYVEGIPLGPASDRDPAAMSMSLETVMRILQPPQRLIAADGRRVVVSVPAGPAELVGVRVFERDASGWREAARLQPAESVEGFGAAVAVHREVAVVSARSRATPGTVHVFVSDATGNWAESQVLSPDSALSGGAFGATVALGEGALFVGAPAAGPGTVVVYGRAEQGSAWTERGRLTGADDAGAAFGASLALLGSELLVGAPGANERRGGAYRFARAADGAWRHAGTLAVPDAEPRSMVGTAVAAGDGRFVLGAPGAGGFQGGALVWNGREGASPEWIVAGTELTSLSGGERRCADGAVAGFACGNVDLEAFVTIEGLGGGVGEWVSDLWGWTDPDTGREYALVGRSGGLVFVDVTAPTRPVVLGTMTANRAGPRDIKVYADHAFLVGDGAGNHGLLVFDLTRLRSVANPPVTFEPDAKYDGIASAHNLVIDTAAGFAYPVGASGGGTTCGGGLHMVDIRTPKEPTFAGCYTDTEGLLYAGRTHDAQCVVYSGPDTEHQGKQVCFASNETAVRIVDVTDKAKPVPLSAAKYPGIAYVHQGWLTDDQRYFYLDDELDELVGTTDRTRTMIWDVEDLDDPVLVGTFAGTTGATDHNLYVKGDRMYQANYQAGLRVIDISDRARPVEVGYFDTTPYEGNPAGFNGAWTAYPFFKSGVVIVSSMGEGLFVLRPRVSPLMP